MSIKEVVKVIVKQGGLNGEYQLFLPEYNVNPGMIMCWERVGQHGEADLGYYHRQRNPKFDDDAATDTIRLYERTYGVTCERVFRQTTEQRTEAWK